MSVCVEWVGILIGILVQKSWNSISSLEMNFMFIWSSKFGLSVQKYDSLFWKFESMN